MIRTLVVDDDFRVAAIHAAYVNKIDGFEVDRGGAHAPPRRSARWTGCAPT